MRNRIEVAAQDLGFAIVSFEVIHDTTPRHAWHVEFGFTANGRAYLGAADAESCELFGAPVDGGAARRLPENHKREWRAAIIACASRLIRDAKQARLAEIEAPAPAPAPVAETPVNIEVTPAPLPADECAPIYHSAPSVDECTIAVAAGQQWAQSLAPGDTFRGTHGEARARGYSADLVPWFAMGADGYLADMRLYDETGARIIGVGLIDTVAVLSEVTR